MMIDKPLKTAFLFSLGIHLVLFSPVFNFAGRPLKLDKKDLEVTYIEIKPEEKKRETSLIEIEDYKPTLKEVETAVKESSQTKDKEPQKDENIKRADAKEKDAQRESIKRAILKRKSIDLNAISYSRESSELFNYFDALRNRIESYILKIYDGSMGRGQARLEFTLNSDGTVQSASIIKDSTGGNKRLKNLYLDSIYHSSPFKPFPKELDLPELVIFIEISI